MPKIYRYLSFILSFYVNDHLPIHVHVKVQQRENEIELIYKRNGLYLQVKRVGNIKQLSEKELNEVKKFIRHYNLQIVAKWNQVFTFNKTVKIEIVRKKL